MYAVRKSYFRRTRAGTLTYRTERCTRHAVVGVFDKNEIRIFSARRRATTRVLVVLTRDVCADVPDRSDRSKTGLGAAGFSSLRSVLAPDLFVFFLPPDSWPTRFVNTRVSCASRRFPGFYYDTRFHSHSDKTKSFGFQNA